LNYLNFIRSVVCTVLRRNRGQTSLGIAQEIEDLGTSYRIQLRSGWVKYLEHANAHGIVQSDIVPQVAPKKIVVTDE
jgi:hypothetical protein